MILIRQGKVQQLGVMVDNLDSLELEVNPALVTACKSWLSWELWLLDTGHLLLASLPPGNLVPVEVETRTASKGGGRADGTDTGALLWCIGGIAAGLL
jgi:hypothetical protein